MLAIVEIAGKQFRISENLDVVVPLLRAEVGAKVKFDKVVYLESDTKKTVGNPLVKGAIVEATVVGHGKDDKILVFRKKKRKNFKVKKGHEQDYTTIHIDNIKQ